MQAAAYKQNFFYHRIPEGAEVKGQTTAAPKPSWLFGILDSSGSMSSHWKFVADNYNQLMDEVDQDKVTTIAFDHSIHEEPKKKVGDKISQYGGGSTNILLAFQEFEKRLEKIPKDDEVKVIFLSDGQDTCNSNLQEKLKTLKGGQGRKITFMCLGVQSGFPTFISMYLREIYHTGDATVPSIFLVEYSSDKAFFNKFQSIRPFIKTKEEIKVEPEQFLFPWEAVSPSIPEGRWIMSEDRKINLNGGAMVLEYDDKNFSIDAVIDIFRSWTQKLQLDSINKKITLEKTREYAESTYNLMMDIIEDIRKSKGLKLLGDSGPGSESEDFNTRVLNLQIKRTGLRVQGYLTSMKELKEGLNLQKLSEFEAAKIIGLGTVVGKHQQRALAMQVITKDKFKQMAQEFTSILATLALHENTDTAPAVNSGLTPVKVFKDKTIKEALDKIESPLVFLELFPLIGIPVKIKRNEGCANDAWQIEIKDYSTENASIDAAQFDLAMHKTVLKEKAGDVEYQGYVPLLGPNDAQLAPLFDTELIKYAISYDAVFEIDIILRDAWLSLLTGLFELAYKKQDDPLLEKIYSTLKVLPVDSGFKKILDAFYSGNGEVLATIKNAGLFYMAIWFIGRENKTKEENREFAEKLWIAYFSTKLETKKIADFVSTEEELGLKDLLKKKYTPEYIMKTFYTGNSIKTHLKVNLEKEIKENDKIGQNSKVILNKNIYTMDTNDVLNFEVTKKLSKEVAGIELTDDDIFVYLSHCATFPDKKSRYSNLLSGDVKAASQALSKEFLTKDDASKKMIKRITYQLLDELSQIYYKEFKRLHWNVIPLTKEEVQKTCEAKKIDFNTLEFDAASGLCKKACCAKTCPWFLFVRKKDRSLRSHLGGWQGFIPPSFHSYIKANPTKTSAEIFAYCITAAGHSKDMQAAGVTEEEVKKYIDDIKQHYKN